METPKLYVGTYGKYNSGSIAGQWLDLEHYSSKDEFYEACRELHEDENDPELMFQDYEDYKCLGLWYSESGINESYWEFLDLTSDWNEDQFEAFKNYCEHIGADVESDPQEAIENYEEAFCCDLSGEHNIEEAFGYYLIDEMQSIEVPENIRYYFDFEAYGRDALMSDFFEVDGFVYWNR